MLTAAEGEADARSAALDGDEEQITLVLLPGLDGTGQLFQRLVDALPSWLKPKVMSYPTDRLESFDKLCKRLLQQIADLGPFVLVGESFSGPVAIRISSLRLPNQLGLILVASFCRSPVGRWGLLTRPIASLMRIRPPRWAVRRFLTGPDPELEEETLAAIRSVDRGVIAHRVRQVLSIDVTADLSTCSVPALYLKGEQDKLVGARVARTLQSVLPSLKVVALNAPHLVLQRSPREAASAIAEFLRDELT